MPTKEEFELAQKELISFLSQYSGMMVEHLNQVREIMAQTTEQVMNGVSDISDTRERKKKMAETILVKKSIGSSSQDKIQGSDDTFQAIVSKDDGGSTDAVPVAQQLKQHIKSFESVDDRIEEILFTMIGSLSADDVVGQRMEHINKALKDLSNELSAIIGTQTALNFKTNEIDAFKDRIFNTMKKSYTMEEEHKVMEKVFSKDVKIAS